MLMSIVKIGEHGCSHECLGCWLCVYRKKIGDRAHRTNLQLKLWLKDPAEHLATDSLNACNQVHKKEPQISVWSGMLSVCRQKIWRI